MDQHSNRKWLVAVVLLVGLAVVAGITIWWKLYRVVPQPAWITADARDNYFYGSVGAGQTAGIPYWVWLEMPRMFPEYMPGPGGYASLGLSWEEGREMPVGFAKQRVGYIRVTGNCALCHAVSNRTRDGRGAHYHSRRCRTYHRYSTGACLPYPLRPGPALQRGRHSCPG